MVQDPKQDDAMQIKDALRSDESAASDIPADEPADKADMRRHLREQLAAMSPEQRKSASADITAALVETPEWQRAKTIMIYLSLAHEVETSGLAYRAWQAGKTVVVPKITSVEKIRMTPVEITSLSETDEGGVRQSLWGLREPAAMKPYPLEQIDFVCVPGLGFSKVGTRIGRGKGFYDRFLGQEALLATSCGIAFDEQVRAALPVEAMDEPIDMLISPSGVLRFRGGYVIGT